MYYQSAAGSINRLLMSLQAQLINRLNVGEAKNVEKMRLFRKRGGGEDRELDEQDGNKHAERVVIANPCWVIS